MTIRGVLPTERSGEFHEEGDANIKASLVVPSYSTE